MALTFFAQALTSRADRGKMAESDTVHAISNFGRSSQPPALSGGNPMQPEKDERPATSADIKAILTELGRLRADMASLRGRVGGTTADLSSPTPLLIPPPSEQLVTLDQIGAMVHRSKRSMERYRKQMPAPRVCGRRGRPHLWAWTEVRPWLEATFGLLLPEYFPGQTH